jgi:hypothetical protein
MLRESDPVFCRWHIRGGLCVSSYQGQAEAIDEAATQMPHQNPADISMAMLQPAAALRGTLVL